MIRRKLQSWLNIQTPRDWGKEFRDAVKGFEIQAQKLEDEMWIHRTIAKEGKYRTMPHMQ